nr:3788_t:CDS:2 [Entrophospora candida]
MFKYIISVPSSSIPSQNSANSNHNRDPNKRQNPANNDRSRIHIRVKTHIVQLVLQVLAKKTDSGGIRDSTTTETPE